MENEKLGNTYKSLRALGFNYSEEEYGRFSIAKVISKLFSNTWLALLQRYDELGNL